MIVGSREEEQVVRELREIVARRPGKDPAKAPRRPKGPRPKTR